jgi:hypothetical protein
MSKIEYPPQIRYQGSIPIHGIFNLPEDKEDSPEDILPERQSSSEKLRFVVLYHFPRSRLKCLLFSREMLRAPLAEFLGVGIFVLLGTASECQMALSSSTKISPISKGVRISLNSWPVRLIHDVRVDIFVLGSRMGNWSVFRLGVVVP